MIKNIVLLAIIIIFGSSCDYFQRKMYTDENDFFGRYFEVCLKGNKADKASGGGNTKNCDFLMKALTPAGRLETFKSCVSWEKDSVGVKKYKNKFNCYDATYGYKCVDFDNCVKSGCF